MKQTDIKSLREKLWLQNNKICPITKITLNEDEIALDHAHKLNSEDYSKDKGTCRDSISKKANVIEGKFINSFKRMYGSDESKWVISPEEFLRNLADYYSKGSYIDEDGYYYIHPSEVSKEPKLMKSSYNKLKKLYKNSNKRGKFPEYPKSKKMIKGLQELFDEFKLEPEYY
jgi:hypothetical protein